MPSASESNAAQRGSFTTWRQDSDARQSHRTSHHSRELSMHVPIGAGGYTAAAIARHRGSSSVYGTDALQPRCAKLAIRAAAAAF